MKSRYEGKPLLRILECYVLDTIGQLSSTDRSNLERMTPKLQSVYKLDGDWRNVIAQTMRFPKSLDDNIRSLWTRNCELAVARGEELLPEDFARMIVDENLVSA
ncbi:MAG: hypothetical protein ACJ8F7_14820 [Gemmataceae bacterium]